MLHQDRTALVLIDVQEKLAALMNGRDMLIDQLVRLVRGCRILGLPVIRAEQHPEGLGPTIPELEVLFEGGEALPKRSFSVCGCEALASALETSGRDQFLVAGIESHVCVYQSCMDLVSRGWEVQVVADAVSSRTVENHRIGLTRCQAAGATLTSVETALFEILRKAEGPLFKEILKIVK